MGGIIPSQKTPLAFQCNNLPFPNSEKSIIPGFLHGIIGNSESRKNS